MTTMTTDKTLAARLRHLVPATTPPEQDDEVLQLAALLVLARRRAERLRLVEPLRTMLVELVAELGAADERRPRGRARRRRRAVTCDA